MKSTKHILIFIILISIFLILVSTFKKKNVNKPSNDDIGIQEGNIGHSEISGDFVIDNMQIIWTIVNPNNIFLYPNFEERLTAEDAFIKHSCNALINGGFYTSDNKPIGLFVFDNNQISSFQKNSIFNGAFYIDKKSTAFISNNYNNNSRLAIQSGPVYVLNNEKQVLETESKNKSRRMLLGILQDNSVILITIYKNDSVFIGPDFEETQSLLKIIELKLDNNILAAINLDGGTASAFYTNKYSLAELSFIGSYFCVK